MKLSILSVLLGVGLGLPQVYGLVNPTGFAAAARKFPRSLRWGYLLMSLGTVWFLWSVQRETITDFAQYKPLMLVGFGAVGFGACFFLKDFLAVRGLAVVLLLLAKVVLDAARLNDSAWRLVLVVWAYLWIVAAMWFIVSPWRLRDLLEWGVASEQRVRAGSIARLAFALLVVVLGVAVL